MAHLTIVDLEEKKLDAAAQLLAERQKRLRKLNALLPAPSEHPAFCRPVIEEGLEQRGARGVGALLDGDLVGYLVMAPIVFGARDMVAAFFPPRPAQMHGSHAARPDVAFDAYREMYAVLADEFVRRGYFDHLVYVPAGDTAAHDAFVSLSFGRALVAAIRNVDPVPLDGAQAELHEAGIEDLNVVMGLGEELLEHHARSPIFWPHLAEPYEGLEAHQRAHFEDPTTVHFVAYQRGTAVGMNSFVPPEWIDRVLRPDKTVYLYQGIVSEAARGGGIGRAILARGVEWARTQGYEHIALHYASPNISGARFWQSQGFKPIEYRLTRHIDERIAWAGA